MLSALVCRLQSIRLEHSTNSSSSITLGIFVAYAINYRTNMIQGDDGASWRITMGIGFVWPLLMVIGITFLPESPRWDYRHNNIERARNTVSRAYGVPINHWEVKREMREIQEKYDAEFAGGGKHVWYEIFTGPRMAYRTLLGVTLQALQQLTGANFCKFRGLHLEAFSLTSGPAFQSSTLELPSSNLSGFPLSSLR